MDRTTLDALLRNPVVRRWPAEATEGHIVPAPLAWIVPEDDVGVSNPDGYAWHMCVPATLWRRPPAPAPEPDGEERDVPPAVPEALPALAGTFQRDDYGRWVFRDATASLPAVIQRPWPWATARAFNGGSVVITQYALLLERFGRTDPDTGGVAARPLTCATLVVPCTAISGFPGSAAGPSNPASGILGVGQLLLHASRLKAGATIPVAVGRVAAVALRQTASPDDGAAGLDEPLWLFQARRVGLGRRDRLLFLRLADLATVDAVDAYLDVRDRPLPLGMYPGAVVEVHALELRLSPKGTPFLVSTSDTVVDTYAPRPAPPARTAVSDARWLIDVYRAADALGTDSRR